VTPRRGSQRAAVALFAHDRRCGGARVAGADEAGRGCLAGPLVAASVCIDLGRLTPGERRALGDLDDSKRLAPEVRERLAAAIWVIAEQVAVASADAARIDRDGLHRTNLRLLAAVLGNLQAPPAACLVDGFALGPGAVAHRAVAGGDRRSAAIAAASVIAKVTRDRLMRELAGRYPGYGLEEHMGYATPRHREAIARLGPTAIHRRSFVSASYDAYARRGWARTATGVP
jgi:ribonuclease HII